MFQAMEQGSSKERGLKAELPVILGVVGPRTTSNYYIFQHHCYHQVASTHNGVKSLLAGIIKPKMLLKIKWKPLSH